MMVLRNQVEAGSWVWPLIVGRPTQQYTVVYPEWKGRRELESSEPPLNPSERARYAVSTEDEWFALPQKRLEVAGLLIVRSGAWSPPWLDPVWTRFVESATVQVGYDPMEWPLRRDHGDASVMLHRPWDWGPSRSIADIQRTILSSHAQSNTDVQPA